MKPVGDAIRFLRDGDVDHVIRLIRRDPHLGRGSYSSWEEVTPSDYEAAERVRRLIEEGIVPIEGDATPAKILAALREAEKAFWGTGDN